MSLVLNLREQAMSVLDETDFDVLPAWLKTRLLNEINAVSQYIYSRGPAQWWSQRPNGDTLLAPITVSSVTVTANSKSLSAVGLTARMNGCTVLCSGQSTQNRIFQTGAATWEFLMPHTGSTVSNATLTVWHDCLNLTDSSVSIYRPVTLAGLWELLPAESVADLQLPAWYRFTSHNIRPIGTGYPVSGWDRQAATPVNYYIDNTQLYSNGLFVPQLRVNPLPDAQYQIWWQEKRKFTRITDWNDSRTSIIPHDYHESVFIPLLIERLAQLPQFSGDKNIAITDATGAREIMRELSDVQEMRDLFVKLALDFDHGRANPQHETPVGAQA